MEEKKGIIPLGPYPSDVLFGLDRNGSIDEAQPMSTPVIVAVVVLGIIIFSVNPYAEWTVRRRLRATVLDPL